MRLSSLTTNNHLNDPFFVSLPPPTLPHAAERTAVLELVGLAEPAVATVSRAAFDLLGLGCFYTAGATEVRAWSIRKGATAVEAAARIHTDIAKGLVRAETYNIKDLVTAGSVDAVRTRHEGKGYIVAPGDVFNFLSRS
jgi:ribosome-binding ATPase